MRTCSASVVTLYVNGRQVGQATGATVTPANLGATTQNWLGRSQFITDPNLNGNMQDVAFYTKSLTSSQIRTHYQTVRPPPTVNTSGDLYQHRDQTTDHRDEGLYNASYGLHVDAQSTNSGVKSIEIQVDGVRKDYAEQLCPLGGCAMARDWTLSSDDYSDGGHTITVNVTDQGGWVTTTGFPVTVGRRGDIYHAAEYDGDPNAGGSTMDEEWAQCRGVRREPSRALEQLGLEPNASERSAAS